MPLGWTTFIPLGGIPERSKGTDCKSVGSAFAGSNPAPATPARAAAARGIGVRGGEYAPRALALAAVDAQRVAGLGIVARDGQSLPVVRPQQPHVQAVV